jgi:type II secretory pathway predicted ATPase ExeA
VRNEIMQIVDLLGDFRRLGYFETEHLKGNSEVVSAAIKLGKLITISWILGSGRTVFLKRLQDELAREDEVLIAKPLSLDKRRVTLPTLLLALFMDLTPQSAKKKEARIPSQTEKQIRKPQHIV